MKKILVTGAAGMIGVHVLKYLLSEGKYEITAIDLKNKRTYERLRKFKRRINILYGDVCDRVLMEALVKDHDVIIHLASSIPPLADMKKGLAWEIDYNGTENIIRSISYYNPKCHLIYASTTSMYKTKGEATVKSKIELDEFDYFNEAKLKTEELIREKLKNYTIYRFSLVLGDLRHDPFMYHGRKNQLMSVITKEDAAYSLVKGINYLKDINHKTYNVTGAEDILYKDLLQKILKTYGISFKYVMSRLFLEKSYYSPTCKDKDLLNDLIDYRSDSLTAYFNRLRANSKKRKVARFLTKPFIKEDSK